MASFTRLILVLAFMAVSTIAQAEVKVLALAGSTRGDSLNKKLVSEAASFAKESGATITLVDLKDYAIPLYDADHETNEGMPQKAQQLRQLFVDSDVILLASPEYNGSITGVLKNAIDWLSRSPNGGPSREAFKGKKFVLMSTSPGAGGGAKGLIHLRAIIEHIGGTVLQGQFVLPKGHEAFDLHNHLKNATAREDLKTLVQNALGG